MDASLQSMFVLKLDQEKLVEQENLKDPGQLQYKATFCSEDMYKCRSCPVIKSKLFYHSRSILKIEKGLQFLYLRALRQDFPQILKNTKKQKSTKYLALKSISPKKHVSKYAVICFGTFFLLKLHISRSARTNLI